MIITGDLNLNLLDVKSEASPGIKLNNFMDIFYCKNLVKERTCYAGNEPSLIDVIITNCSKKLSKTIRCNTSLSDHHYMAIGVLKRHASCVKNRYITYRSYINLNAEALERDVEQIPFSVCSIFDDIDDSYWAFNKLFKEVVDDRIPMKERRTRKHEAPFINTDYRKMLRKKANYWHVYLNNKNNANWQKYRFARNRCSSLKRSAIKEYFDDRCQWDTKGKAFWKTIRPFLANKGQNQNTIVLRENDEIKTNTSDVCDIINVAADIGPMQNGTDYTNHPSIEAIKHRNIIPESFAFKTVGNEEVYTKLRDLKYNKATGCDQIPAKVIKMVAQDLATPLASIINASINQSRFQQDLKLADVSSVFKKKDNLD